MRNILGIFSEKRKVLEEIFEYEMQIFVTVARDSRMKSSLREELIRKK